jgi:kumamolisin
MSLIRNSVLYVAVVLGAPTLAEQITTTLHLKERVSMQELAQNVHNPASSHFNRFYEPSEIRQLAAPTDAQYNDLVAGLKAEGFAIVSESPTHLWLSVRGEHAIYESLLNTRIQFLGNGLHTHMQAVQIPIQLSMIDSVAGLDNRRKSHPHMKFGPRLSSPGGGISLDDIRAAYGFNPLYSAGLSGNGQHLAIATYDGFKINNVNTFYRMIGLSAAPVVDQVTFNGTPAYNVNSAGESELDVEFSGMIAPGANIHVFASADNSDAGELAMFTAILDDNRAKVVNYSWGNCETDLTAQHQADMNTVFARAVAQGVNVTVATGDNGSDSCGDNTFKADWPAASPYVVAVGGTSFNYAGGVLSETGWKDSGGGISAIWKLPTWQNGLGGIFTMRSYPDVSFNADPNSGQAIYTGDTGQTSWMIVGGTSMAAPQWAGFLILVGEARQTAGKGDIGYIAPIIYGLTSDQRASMFHDVTSGNNGLYSCNAGWDAVTGWGSMQADALLAYFKGL